MTNLLPWPPKSWNYRCEPHLSQRTVDFYVGIWKLMINSSETALWHAGEVCSLGRLHWEKQQTVSQARLGRPWVVWVARDYPSLCFAELWIRSHTYANSVQAGPLQLAAPPVPQWLKTTSPRFLGEPRAPHWLQQACWRCVIIIVHQNLCQPWVPKYPAL